MRNERYKTLLNMTDREYDLSLPRAKKNGHQITYNLYCLKRRKRGYTDN